MTEDVKLDQEDQEVDNTEEVTLSPAEEEATLAGWRPKEEWDGDPDDWKDAKTFLRDGELFKKIEEIKRENKNLRKTMTSLKTHYDKVRESEYQRAMVQLKLEKKEALQEGDADRVIDIDDQIDAKKEELALARQAEDLAREEPEIHPEFAQWVEQNRWYERNAEVRDFADSVGVAYKRGHPAATPKEVLKYVEDRVAKGYPELFKNPRRNAPSSVEGGQPPRKSSPKIMLTDMETRMMKSLVRSGALTEEQYMKDIEEMEKQGKR